MVAVETLRVFQRGSSHMNNRVSSDAVADAYPLSQGSDPALRALEALFAVAFGCSIAEIALLKPLVQRTQSSHGFRWYFNELYKDQFGCQASFGIFGPLKVLDRCVCLESKYFLPVGRVPITVQGITRCREVLLGTLC